MYQPVNNLLGITAVAAFGAQCAENALFIPAAQFLRGDAQQLGGLFNRVRVFEFGHASGFHWRRFCGPAVVKFSRCVISLAEQGLPRIKAVLVDNRRFLQAVLAGNQALHELEVACSQSQRSIHPDADDIFEFFVGDLVHPAPHRSKRSQAVA